MTDDTTKVDTTNSAAEPWYKGADDETVGYITNRGLDKKTPAEAALATIKSHREATARLGAPPDQLIRLPKDASDEKGWNEFYTKLGKPAKPEDYDLKAATEAGAGDGFVNFAREFAFKNNLTKAQGEELAKQFVAYAEKSGQTDQQAALEAIEVERVALKKDWGPNWDANRIIAREAAVKLGITPEAVAALEKAAGYGSAMSALLKMGLALGEGRFVTSETTGNVMTASGAKERIAELKKDDAWVKKYIAGDVQARKEMTNLIRMSVG